MQGRGTASQADLNAPLPPPAVPPTWAAVLHLLTPHLKNQADRSAVRQVCREWRAAADSAWHAACFTCLSLPADAAGAAAAASCLLSPGAFPLAHLSELCLVDSPATLPVLLRLALSAPLAVRLQDGGLLGSLELPGLQRLALDDIELAHGLASLTQLQQLTELCFGLSASPFGHQQGLSCAAPPGVAHLPSLRRLQVGAGPAFEPGVQWAPGVLGFDSLRCLHAH